MPVSANACIFLPVSLFGPPGPRQARTPYPNGHNLLFCGREPWPQTLTFGLPSCLLHTWLQIAPAPAEGHRPMEPKPRTMSSARKAEIKFQGSQPSSKRLSLEMLSIMLQKGLRTWGNPGRVQHTLETCLYLCREYGPTSGLDSDGPYTP